jgi:hypothetical protein
MANVFVDLAGAPLSSDAMHELTNEARERSLADLGERLVQDFPIDDPRGPVFPLIRDRLRDFGADDRGRILKSCGEPFQANLTHEQMRLVNAIWRRSRVGAAAGPQAPARPEARNVG